MNRKIVSVLQVSVIPPKQINTIKRVGQKLITNVISFLEGPTVFFSPKVIGKWVPSDWSLEKPIVGSRVHHCFDSCEVPHFWQILTGMEMENQGIWCGWIDQPCFMVPTSH